MLENGKQTTTWDAYTNRKVTHSDPVYLKRDTWAIVHSESDYDQASDCFENMTKASKTFGIKVEEPKYFEVDDK
jgi:hypothetical protein